MNCGKGLNFHAGMNHKTQKQKENQSTDLRVIAICKKKKIQLTNTPCFHFSKGFVFTQKDFCTN